MPVEPETIRVRWYGRVWNELLDTEEKDYVKLTYAVMTSFGPVCRAGLKRISLRVSRSPKTVRKAQRRLEILGWIVLVKEGANQSPREWRVLDIPEPPVITEDPSGDKQDTPAGEGASGGNPGSVGDPQPPPSGDPKHSENSLSDCSLPDRTPEATWNPIAVTMREFKISEVRVTDRDPRRLAVLTARANAYGEEIFTRIVREYLQNELCIRGGRTIEGLLRNLDRLGDIIIRSRDRKERDEIKRRVILERNQQIHEEQSELHSEDEDLRGLSPEEMDKKWERMLKENWDDPPRG